VERRSSSGCDGRSEARTQGAPIVSTIGATEDAASGRAARPDGTADVSPSPPRQSLRHRIGNRRPGATVAASTMPSTFNLVFVCTANRARSPTAAAVAASLLSAETATVRSCGIAALEGLPALPQAVVAADRLGIDIRGHRSHPLDASVADADLVVGFELSHVATAIVDGGAPRGRTFTLHELASLLLQPQAGPSRNDDDPVARARRLVAEAGTRSRADATLPRELVDPVGRPQRVFDEVALEIDALTRRIVYALFGLA